jgi:arsenate reductase
MAEGWARTLKGDVIEPYSAGIAPHGLDPLALRVMAEAGVDMSTHRSKDLAEFSGVEFDFVVTVCDHARESCPIFPASRRSFTSASTTRRGWRAAQGAKKRRCAITAA